MGGLGLTQRQVGLVLGIDAKTLAKHYPDDLECGTAILLAKCGNTLAQAALKGNVIAAMFIMKARGGWQDRIAVTGKFESKTTTQAQVNVTTDAAAAESARLLDAIARQLAGGAESQAGLAADGAPEPAGP